MPMSQVIISFWEHNQMHGPFTWFFDDGVKIEGETENGAQVGLQVHT